MTVEKALGHTFSAPGHLEVALTHSSHAHEHGGPDNERLEFLGDAILQGCVTALLHDRYPDDAEGRLTDRRQRLVNTDRLAEVARALGLGPALRLGRGEESSGGRDKATVLAGAVEAVLGAVFLDAGFDVTREVVERVFAPWLAHVDTLPDAPNDRFNPKSRLQELTQARGLGAPTYEVVGQDGPPHAPTWHVQARLDGEVIGHGTGAKKGSGERAAALDAIERLQR